MENQDLPSATNHRGLPSQDFCSTAVTLRESISCLNKQRAGMQFHSRTNPPGMGLRLPSTSTAATKRLIPHAVTWTPVRPCLNQHMNHFSFPPLCLRGVGNDDGDNLTNTILGMRFSF